MIPRQSRRVCVPSPPWLPSFVHPYLPLYHIAKLLKHQAMTSNTHKYPSLFFSEDLHSFCPLPSRVSYSPFTPPATFSLLFNHSSFNLDSCSIKSSTQTQSLYIESTTTSMRLHTLPTQSSANLYTPPSSPCMPPSSSLTSYCPPPIPSCGLASF